MKLTYRGVTYEQSRCSLEMKEGEILGKYRGMPVHERVLASPIERPEMDSVELTFRGGSYLSPQVKVAVRSQVAPLVAPSCPIRLPQLSQVISPDLGNVHLQNMRNNLERRLQAARAKGDEQLIRLLQQESQELRHG